MQAWRYRFSDAARPAEQEELDDRRLAGIV
jgi:hypothetical protein